MKCPADRKRQLRVAVRFSQQSAHEAGQTITHGAGVFLLPFGETAGQLDFERRIGLVCLQSQLVAINAAGHDDIVEHQVDILPGLGNF